MVNDCSKNFTTVNVPKESMMPDPSRGASSLMARFLATGNVWNMKDRIRELIESSFISLLASNRGVYTCHCFPAWRKCYKVSRKPFQLAQKVGPYLLLLCPTPLD